MASQALLFWSLLGSDATVHMAEETENASIVIPKAMIWSYVVTGITDFVILIAGDMNQCDAALAIPHDQLVGHECGLRRPLRGMNAFDALNPRFVVVE